MINKSESEVLYEKYFNNILDIGPKILKDYIIYITTIRGDAINTAANYYRDLILFFKFILQLRGKEIDYSELNDKDDYDKIVALLAPHVHEVLVRSIRKEDILKFLYHLKADNDNSAKGRNRRLSALRSFFNYVDSELAITDYNPTTYIKPARIEKNIPKYLTLEEAIRLLDSVPPSPYYSRNYCILVFFLNLGLRSSELIKIDITDIKDSANGKVIIIKGKGSKERVLNMNVLCQKAYEMYMEDRMSSYIIKHEYKDALFISRRGRRVSKTRVYEIVLNCLEAAGLSHKGLSPHKLRHSFATILYQYGNVELETLRMLLGHENVGTTQIYTHVDNKTLREATSLNPLSNINTNQATIQNPEYKMLPDKEE